jgi:hypothetical protein
MIRGVRKSAKILTMDPLFRKVDLHIAEIAGGLVVNARLALFDALGTREDLAVWEEAMGMEGGLRGGGRAAMRGRRQPRSMCLAPERLCRRRWGQRRRLCVFPEGLSRAFCAPHEMTRFPANDKGRRGLSRDLQ